MEIVDAVDLLSGHHLALGDLFARHQEALLDRRWADAARLLEEYEQGLLRHIDFEERYMLPPSGGGANARWPSRVYRAEHRRIEQLLRKAADRLTCARGSEITPSILISLLDEERTLKHLVQHHHEREEKALFLELRGAGALSSEGNAGARNVHVGASTGGPGCGGGHKEREHTLNQLLVEMDEFRG